MSRGLRKALDVSICVRAVLERSTCVHQPSNNFRPASASTAVRPGSIASAVSAGVGTRASDVVGVPVKREAKKTLIRSTWAAGGGVC